MDSWGKRVEDAAQKFLQKRPDIERKQQIALFFDAVVGPVFETITEEMKKIGRTVVPEHTHQDKASLSIAFEEETEITFRIEVDEADTVIVRTSSDYAPGDTRRGTEQTYTALGTFRSTISQDAILEKFAHYYEFYAENYVPRPR